MRYIRDTDSTRVLEILSDLGIRGIVKSLYHSTRYTGTLNQLILSPRVISEIASGANLNLQSPLLVGLQRNSAGHPKLGRSKLSVANGGKITTNRSGPARIGPCSVVHVEGDFSMGYSFANAYLHVMCEEKISIGDGCAIAWNVQFLDSNRHDLWIDGEEVDRTGPIIIEDDVWIGHDVTIKKGVTIGEGAIVASDSVVTSDVPSRTLVAGVPARPIQENVRWD